MLTWSQLSSQQRQQALQRPALADAGALQSTVADIIRQVENDGDRALFALSEKFDNVRLDNLRLPEQQISNAADELTDEVKSAIELAYENIRAFHQAQRPADVELQTSPGVICQLKHIALDAVGLYIPGGTAPLPSTVLMLGATAQVAGCARKILCTPAGQEGRIAAEIRYAAYLCGINEIYLVGGAQAIAAMALGTESIAKVDKIFGPGNSYVTEAKQQVSQRADGAAIDMPAGPSEVLVIADGAANPAFIAADLLSQAEHGKDSQAILVSDNEQIIEQTKQQVELQLAQLPRQEIARVAIGNSRFILTDDIAQSVEVSNAYAPEHLIIQTQDAEKLVDQVKYAGSIFVGQWSPESAGDYASGTNHVLPTYGYSRTYSSLGLLDFMRRFTVQQLSETGIRALGPAIMALADAEGLDAHKQAVALRLEALK